MRCARTMYPRDRMGNDINVTRTDRARTQGQEGLHEKVIAEKEGHTRGRTEKITVGRQATQATELAPLNRPNREIRFIYPSVAGSGLRYFPLFVLFQPSSA